MRKKYFVNGFKSLHYGPFKKSMRNEFEFTYFFPEPHKMDFIKNYFVFKKMVKNGLLKDYDVVHLNNWENFLNYERVSGQISIGMSHGFHVGANFKRFLEDEDSLWKKAGSLVMELFLKKKMIRKINEFDIYYVSTPDMVQPLKEVRSDVKWLPNIVDTKKFCQYGLMKRLTGHPSIFFPTRLHGDKKPEVGIKIFQEHILPKYPKAKMHFLKQPFNDQWRKWKKELGTEHYTWDLEFMNHEELIKHFRGADLVMGGFSIGALGLMELESMSCGTPVICNDQYELHTLTKDLGEHAVKLLKDRDYKQLWIKKGLEHVKNVHGIEAVTALHKKNLDEARIKQLGFEGIVTQGLHSVIGDEK